MLICDYINKDLLKSNVNGLVIHTKFSVSTIEKHDDLLSVIKEIKDNKKLAYVNIDKIIYEYELDELKALLDCIKDPADYIIYSDYSVLSILDKKYWDKLIYYPKTLVCNYKEAEFIDTNLFVSNEISFDEIKKINDNIKDKDLCIKVFGYLSIFYTKRNLLTLYNDFVNENVLKKDKVYDLKEELRLDNYKIFESDFGSIIYTPFIYALYDEIKELNNFKVFYLSFDMIESDKVIEVINCYYDYINQGINNFDKLNSLFNNLGRGFLDKKSILLKDNENE